MHIAKDLYAVLGLARGASPEDIKKAYRKMSKEWHPDKHKGEKNAEAKFKEINEAYEVLSNPERKNMYDQFGSTGANGASGQGGFGGFNANGFDFSGFDTGDLGDLFGSFFGGARGRQHDPADGLDREIQITIDFADVVHGAKKELQLRRMVVCTTCEGKGAEPGSEIVTCGNCGGTGQTVKTVNSFFGRIQQRTMCATCAGSGKVPKEPCHTCKGEGRVQQTDTVVIDIPPGLDDGQALRIADQGDAGLRSGKRGSLYVRIRVRPDPRFERDGADIRSTISVPVIDAILGGEIDVETVQGTSKLQVPDGLQPGQVFRIRGKGMPILGRSSHGDHYVVLNVEIPKKLSKAEKKLLEEWRKLKS